MADGKVFDRDRERVFQQDKSVEDGRFVWAADQDDICSNAKPIQDTTLLQSVDEVVNDVLNNYQPEIIISIAKDCKTLNEFAIQIGCPYDCRAARVITTKLRIDTKHFKRFKCEMPDEYIKEICKRSDSYYEMGQWLGYTPQGAFAGAKRQVEHQALLTDHFHKDRLLDDNLSRKNLHQWNPNTIDIILERLCIEAVSTGDWFYCNSKMNKYPLVIYPRDVSDDPDYIIIQNLYKDLRFEAKRDKALPLYGFIYLITNLITGLQYIGQTTQSVAQRWRSHMTDGEHYPGSSRIDDAIQIFGSDNFEIETIDDAYSYDELNDKEIYWIAKYDCCAQDGEDKGYNWERGGGQIPAYILDEKYIIDLYKKGKSFIEISNMIGTRTTSPIRRIIDKHGLIRTREENLSLLRASYNCCVARIDDEGNVLQLYPSYADAGIWLLDQGLSNAADINNAASGVRSACIHSHKSYGYNWIVAASYEELNARIKNFIEEKIEKTKHSLDNQVLAESPASQKKISAIHKKVPAYEKAFGTASKAYKHKKRSKTKQCEFPECSRRIMDTSHYCVKHSQIGRHRRTELDIEETVLNVILYGFEETGRKHQISGKAIAKRLKSELGLCSKQDVLKYALEKNIYFIPVTDDELAILQNDILSGKSYSTLRRSFPQLTRNLYQIICDKLNLSADEVQEKQLARQAQLFERNHKSVELWSYDGNNCLQIFDDLNSAAHSIENTTASLTSIRKNIKRCCNGDRKTAYGKVWKWHKENHQMEVSE